MANTSSNLPICIHCATPRPADESLCPNCGKPWIDVSVSDAVAVPDSTASQPPEETAAEPPLGLGPDDTGELAFNEWTLPPEPKRNRSRWLVPLVLLIAVVGAWSLVAMRDNGGQSTATVAAAAVTTTTHTPTTLPPTSSTTTTTEPPTTTSSTTTTVPYPLAAEWSGTGDSVPTSELGLGAAGIGLLRLGDSLEDVAGILVASLGQADAAALDSDACDGTEWYKLSWGHLSAYFDGYDEQSSFVAYRYEDTGTGATGKRFETLSGVSIGDTIGVLQDTYSSYSVFFEVISGKDYFRLSSGGELLLWGPITGTDPETDTVEGIYSPDPCTGTS
ncbi:MAG: hypothetical protein ABFR95_07775 [Actinomycetota bacterium]